MNQTVIGLKGSFALDISVTNNESGPFGYFNIWLGNQCFGSIEETYVLHNLLCLQDIYATSRFRNITLNTISGQFDDNRISQNSVQSAIIRFGETFDDYVVLGATQESCVFLNFIDLKTNYESNLFKVNMEIFYKILASAKNNLFPHARWSLSASGDFNVACKKHIK